MKGTCTVDKVFTKFPILKYSYLRHVEHENGLKLELDTNLLFDKRIFGVPSWCVTYGKDYESEKLISLLYIR